MTIVRLLNISTFLLVLFFLSIVSVFGELKVVLKINNNIITSHDLIKEINYLKIFNPDIEALQHEQKLQIAKNSLTAEIIKKEELKKFFKIKNDNPYLDEHLQNFFSKLNVKDELEFKNKFENENFYDLYEIIEKINIELYWNELIFLKFKDQVMINEDELKKKISNLKNKENKEYLFSEIIFRKDKDKNLENTIQQIILSINEIGFGNTANIYSIADSSKSAGKIGWIKEENLSQNILDKIKDLNTGEYSSVIKLGNNFLILKIEDIKIINSEVDEIEELKKMINFETNRQLNKLSKIFFDRAFVNYSVDEN